jgi:hypothetical protein
MNNFLTLKIMAVRSCESREEITQPLGVIIQKTWFFNTKRGLQVVKFFQSCVISSGYSGNLTATLSVSFAVVLFLSLAFIQAAKYYRRFTYRGADKSLA